MNVPSTVIIQQQRAEILSDLRMAIKSVQDAVNILRGISDVGVPHSASVEDWKNALTAAAERKESAKRAINGDPSLTGEEKESKLRGWKLWHKAVAGHVGGIIRTLQKWPQASWQWDAVAENIVVGRPTADIADEMATRPVPPEAKQHGRLLGKIYESIADLRRWEQHHNVRKLPIEALLKTPAESLGEQWATGSILRQHGLDNVTASRVAVFESTFI